MSVINRPVASRHRVNLRGCQPSLQTVIGIGIAVLPFAADAPATVIRDLNPRIALAPVVTNLEGDTGWEISLARGFDNNLYSQALFPCEWQGVGIHEHLRGTTKESAPEYETEHHRQELRIEGRNTIPLGDTQRAGGVLLPSSHYLTSPGSRLPPRREHGLAQARNGRGMTARDQEQFRSLWRGQQRQNARQ